MAIADDAVLDVTGNTVYSNYNGFVFGQNTTRDNDYTVIVDDNSFYGSADHIWVEVSGANTTHATIKATSDNTVNVNTFSASDIKTNVTTWTSYAGVDVVTDEDGKVIGGTLANFSSEDVIADGYELGEDGKVIEKAPSYVAKIGEQGFDTLADAFAAAKTGDEVKILTAGTYSLSGISGKNITVTGKTEGVVFTNIGAFNMGGANVTFSNVSFNWTNENYKRNTS